MKDKIIKETGIDLIGFTDLKGVKTFRKENLIYDLDKYKSAIVIGVPYFKSNKRVDNIKRNEVYFSSSSWGEDYHKVVQKRLDEIIKIINDKDAIGKVDTSILNDKYLGYKAGLGFYGKNNLLINKKYGSYFFIGIVLTTLELEKDKTVEYGCSDCNLCVEACPTKAIASEYEETKCLSYITQKKGELSLKEKEHMNNCIYGCDICAKVCPYNKNADYGIKEFKLQGKEIINIDDYKPLTNKEFNKKYGDLSGSWKGKGIIERNIKIYKDKR